MKMIKTRDTGREFFLDLEDWKMAKEVQWFEEDGEIVTKNGNKLLNYLGIKGEKSKNFATYDYRRAAFLT